MTETNRKFKNYKKVKKNKVKLTGAEFKLLLKGLTDEEFELLSGSSKQIERRNRND